MTNVSEALTACIIKAMKSQSISTRLYGATSQKTIIFILAAVRT
jgi:hypothetical protein